MPSAVFTGGDADTVAENAGKKVLLAKTSRFADISNRFVRLNQKAIGFFDANPSDFSGRSWPDQFHKSLFERSRAIDSSRTTSETEIPCRAC